MFFLLRQKCTTLHNIRNVYHKEIFKEKENEEFLIKSFSLPNVAYTLKVCSRLTPTNIFLNFSFEYIGMNIIKFWEGILYLHENVKLTI
jgi:hypothetical protein